MNVDIAARIGELGRQPRAARKFFDRYQDRILFGTDATPHGDESAADFRRRPLRNLLPLPRDRGRVLRLRARDGSAAGTMADFGFGIAGRDPAQSVLAECREPAEITLRVCLSNNHFESSRRIFSSVSGLMRSSVITR